MRSQGQSDLAPSRARGLAQLRRAVDAPEPRGIALVTGPAGIGKSRLLQELRRIEPKRGGRVWIPLDCAPRDTPLDLLSLILRAVGHPAYPGMRLAWMRAEVASALADRKVAGTRYALMLDEAQNATSGVWEEIRLLSNHLGAAEGLAAIVAAGNDFLDARMEQRRLAAVAARVIEHVRLEPLTRDEAVDLFRARLAHSFPNDAELDSILELTAGNPQQLLTQARRILDVAAPSDVEPEGARPFVDEEAGEFEAIRDDLGGLDDLPAASPAQLAGDELAHAFDTGFARRALDAVARSLSLAPGDLDTISEAFEAGFKIQSNAAKPAVGLDPGPIAGGSTPFETTAPSAREDSLLGASRPPRTLEDGVVEIGWDDDESDDAFDDDDDEAPVETSRDVAPKFVPSFQVARQAAEHDAVLENWEDWGVSLDDEPDPSEWIPVASPGTTGRVREDSPRGFAPFGINTRPRTEPSAWERSDSNRSDA